MVAPNYTKRESKSRESDAYESGWDLPVVGWLFESLWEGGGPSVNRRTLERWRGKNPLAKEESIEEDDSGHD